MKKILIIISLIAIFVCATLNFRYINKLKSDINIKKRDIMKCYEQVNTVKENDKFVFLGDSITDWYPIEDMFDKDIPIINSGVAGYETHDILDKMDEMVYKYNPSKVFILIGTNDLKYKDDDEDKVAKNIEEIANNIKKKLPKTKIYLQSIYPVNRKLKDNACEERYNDEIKKVNNELKKYCFKNGVTYINMYDKLSDEDGNFLKKYTKDGLHPSDLGYMKITSTLLKYIY